MSTTACDDQWAPDPNAGASDKPGLLGTLKASTKRFRVRRPKDQPQHWYAFAYRGECIMSLKPATASTYTGYPDKRITLRRIEENKRYAGVRKEAALLGVSYLGYMSREEFENDD